MMTDVPSPPRHPGQPARASSTPRGRGRGASPSPKGPICEACVAVVGLPKDATLREVQILFSGCPGLGAVVMEEAEGQTFAVCQFAGPEEALQAAKSRKNTRWGLQGPAVTLEVRRLEHLEELLQMRGVLPKLAACSRPKSVERAHANEANEGCLPRRGWKDRAKDSGPVCSIEMHLAKARVEEALKKNKLAELETALLEAERAGVAAAELAEAQRRCRTQQHRLAVRAATFAQQRARNRLADAWEGLDQNLESSKRLALLDQALRDGDEAAKLCGKAAQKMEEARLREAVQVLGQKWIRSVQQSLQLAMRSGRVTELRVALAEGEAILNRLGSLEAKKEEENTEEVATSDPGNLEAFKALLEEGRRALLGEERRGVAEQRLSEALQRSDPRVRGKKLSELLHEFRDSVSSSLVAQAEARLKELDAQATARWWMFTASLRAQDGTLASCSSGASDVKFAIKAAKEVGLTKAQLQAALGAYEKLEKLQAIFLVLSDALKDTDAKQVKEVLHRVTSTGISERESPLIAVYLRRLRVHLGCLESS